jgi:hypothetical protein
MNVLKIVFNSDEIIVNQPINEQYVLRVFRYNNEKELIKYFQSNKPKYIDLHIEYDTSKIYILIDAINSIKTVNEVKISFADFNIPYIYTLCKQLLNLNIFVFINIFCVGLFYKVHELECLFWNENKCHINGTEILTLYQRYNTLNLNLIIDDILLFSFLMIEKLHIGIIDETSGFIYFPKKNE